MALHPQGMETLDQILSASPDLIFVQDHVGRCSYVNVATARALGVERHQLLGKMLKDWELPSDIAQLLTAQRDLVFSRGVSISGEIILSNFYQSPRNYEYIYSPIQDNTGSVLQVIFTARDITLRKQAEIALRESEEKYRSLFDAASDAILIADFATGRLLNVNWSTARQLGYPRRELLQLSMADIEADFASPYHYHARTKQLEVDGSAVFEALYRRQDGSTFPVEIHAQVIEYENKLVIQSFVRDITERKRAEAEIRQLATLHAQQQQERVIGRIAQQVHQSLELEQVLHTSVTEVQQFLRTDRVLIYRLGSSQIGRVVVESVSPGWKSVQAVHLEDYCLTLDQIEACQQGTILAIEDINNATLSPDAAEFLHTLQVRASLVLPIMQAQQLWGGLIIHHCQAPRVWQAIEIDLLKQLVVQIGIAIQQAELYQNLQTELQERKRGEAALRESEEKLRRSRERFRAVVDTQLELICRFLPDGTLTFVNDAYCRYFQRSRTALVGTNLLDLLAPAHRDSTKAHFSSFTPETPVQVIEHQVLLADGRLCWHQWSDHAFFDSNQQVIEFQAVGRDITESKRTEAALRQSEAMNRILVNANPNLVIRMTRSGQYLDFIPTKDFEIIQPFPDMCGCYITDVMPAEVVQQRLHYINLALETGRTQTYEYRLTINGKSCYQEAQIAVSGSDEVVVVIRDISERKQEETLLQEREEQFRQMVELLQAVFFSYSADCSQLLYVSPVYEQIWGRSCDSLYQEPGDWFEAVHPDDRAKMQLVLEERLVKEDVEETYRIIRPDGSIRWILGRSTLIRNQAGEIYRIIGFAKDISHFATTSIARS